VIYTCAAIPSMMALANVRELTASRNSCILSMVTL